MNTGGGVLREKMRPEYCSGVFFPDIVSCNSPDLAGGAWIDAPDYFPAGGMYRSESWNGIVGRANAQQIVAVRLP